MEITETSTEGLKHQYKVTVSASEIAAAMESKLKSLAKGMKLQGFRPGKVPVSLVRQRYGQSVLGEVLDQSVKDSSQEAIRQHQLRPALQPKVEIQSFADGADLVFGMSIEVLPEIGEVDLAGLELERLKPEIPEEEVHQALERLAERYRKSETVEDGSAAQSGEIVVIDAVGYVDGKAFEGGKLEEYELELGSKTFIPGFEDQLIGAKPGDHVAVKTTFPEDYAAAQLKGKEAVFEVDVKGLKRKLPPVVDAGLAEQLGMENLEELRTTLSEQIARDYAGLARQKMKRQLLDKLAALYSFDVPSGMVDLEFNSIWKEYEEERQESTDPKPEGAEGLDQAVKIEFRAIAERRVRLGLLLAEIGRHHGVQVSQEELNRAIAGEARRHPSQFKEVLEYYRDNPEAANMLRAPILEEKVVDLIFEKAQVTEKSIGAKELVAMIEAEEKEDVGLDSLKSDSPESADPAAGEAAQDKQEVVSQAETTA